MSLRIAIGDVLDAKEDIIAHQVNCRGKMGAGVAKQIRERWPRAYSAYMDMCRDEEFDSNFLLGKSCPYAVQRPIDGSTVIIFNMFSQGSYGRNDNLCYTDYEALRKCLLELRLFALESGMSIAMPYGIGCGLGGGDWNGVVYPMLKELFENFGVNVVLYKKGRDS